MSRNHEVRVRLPLAAVRWGFWSGGGIAAVIASGRVHDHTEVWALVVLGVVGQCSDVALAVYRRHQS
jgi:hypothetical protein